MKFRRYIADDAGGCPGSWNQSTPLCVNEVRTYWFAKNPQSSNPPIIVVSRPQYPIWPPDETDASMQDSLRVVADCMIQIFLYGMDTMQFDYKNGGIFFHGGTNALNYYFDVGYIFDSKQRAYGATFHAKYRGPSDWVRDVFDVKLTAFPYPATDREHFERSVSVTFDPGVCNPGDDPNGHPLIIDGQ